VRHDGGSCARWHLSSTSLPALYELTRCDVFQWWGSVLWEACYHQRPYYTSFLSTCSPVQHYTIRVALPMALICEGWWFLCFFIPVSACSVCVCHRYILILCRPFVYHLENSLMLCVIILYLWYLMIDLPPYCLLHSHFAEAAFCCLHFAQRGRTFSCAACRPLSDGWAHQWWSRYGRMLPLLLCGVCSGNRAGSLRGCYCVLPAGCWEICRELQIVPFLQCLRGDAGKASCVIPVTVSDTVHVLSLLSLLQAT